MFLQANKFMVLGCFGSGWKSFDLKLYNLCFHGVMECSWDCVSLILVAIVMWCIICQTPLSYYIIIIVFWYPKIHKVDEHVHNVMVGEFINANDLDC
jgi:hypothetical protein